MVWPFSSDPTPPVNVLDLGYVVITPDTVRHDIPVGNNLGEGSYRVVYSLGDDWVLKVPGDWGYCRRVDSLKANKLEVERYWSWSEEDRVFFTKPILWSSDYEWTIHERVSQGEYGDRWASLEKLRPIADRLGVNDLTGNTGFRGDQPVIFDYAGFI